MPLIGTAGHVDHGKSTLIQRITGRDPDRWEVEKRRGLTIDLGFAWTNLPDGTEVSFVDVPGHERYLKNMLAGIEAIDVALLVVAADEGWKPQSEEHLAVLDLLGVERGVVALTKTDLVDDDLVDLARAEVADRLDGTTLEKAPIVAVSGTTGNGLELLLATLVDQIPRTIDDRGRPRLWVDRSFVVAGAGTVVTGTLLDGSMSVEDQVEIYPTGRVVRVRGVQSHEQTHRTIGPGRRVAMNLGSVDHDQVGRGHMIGVAGQWVTTRRFTASVRVARYVDELKPKGAYQLHLGSGAQGVEIVGVEGGIAMLSIIRPLPLKVGDRFIIRDTGRKLVVAGGRVLDPDPGARTRHAIRSSRVIDPQADPDTAAEALLTIRSEDRPERLLAHTGGGVPKSGEYVGDRVLSPHRLADLIGEATTQVEQEHRDHPLRTGLPLATLAERLGLDLSETGALVDKSETLQRVGPDVARIGHAVTLDEGQSAAWEAAVERLSESLAVPNEMDLGLDTEVVHLKIRSGELVRVATGIVFLPGQIEELKQRMSALGDDFTVAQFRDAVGLSRKYAVPILEWADKEGLTVRRGDTRSLR